MWFVSPRPRDTLTNFGAKQAENYRDILLDAMTDLANGPDIFPVIASEAKQSKAAAGAGSSLPAYVRTALDCFASLAMTDASRPHAAV